MIKNIILPLLGAMIVSISANAAPVNASTIKIRLKEFWVSTSKQCTNPIKLYTNPAPSVGVEITTAPDLGSGRLAPGTYECVILVMSDYIEYTPSSTLGTCTAAQAYSKDLCRSGTSTGVDGTVTTCTDGVEDTMTLYVSTASAGGGNMAAPTTNSGDPNGENLTAALVKVAGVASSGTFQFQTTGALSSAHANCSPEFVSFGFVP